MSRISRLFDRKKTRVLNVYFTAGYPSLDSTKQILSALQQHGADMVEIGIPYSDPLADGPVIQASNNVALQNGMSIRMLLEQLKDLRKNIRIPVILMGYLNPILQFGWEAFCREAAAVGVDGLIIPDMPALVFEKEYAADVRKNGLDFVFLVSPETSAERLNRLDALSTGFIYAVSSSGITGSGVNVENLSAYLARLSNLKNPVLVGFGIRSKTDFDAACQQASGAIIGTAYINALSSGHDIEKTTAEFLDGILGEERRTGLEPAAFSLGN